MALFDFFFLKKRGIDFLDHFFSHEIIGVSSLLMVRNVFFMENIYIGSYGFMTILFTEFQNLQVQLTIH